MSDLEKARPGKIGKAYPADGSEQSHNLRVDTQQGGGGTVVQYNQLSTPLAIAAICCFFVAGILGGVSLGVAFNANDKAGQARMEARLAQEDLIMLRATVRAAGIKVESASDHD